MSAANPDRYEKSIGLKLSAEEHRKLKMLSVRQGKSIKAVLLEALDIAFPDWRKEDNEAK